MATHMTYYKDRRATNSSPQVGLTDYKDHMGTNLSPKVDQWVGQGEARWDHMTHCRCTKYCTGQVGPHGPVCRGGLLDSLH